VPARQDWLAQARSAEISRMHISKFVFSIQLALRDYLRTEPFCRGRASNVIHRDKERFTMNWLHLVSYFVGASLWQRRCIGQRRDGTALQSPLQAPRKRALLITSSYSGDFSTRVNAYALVLRVGHFDLRSIVTFRFLQLAHC